MFIQFKAIFQKEWMDMLRDKRTIVAAFAYAVFGPIFLGFFIQFMADMRDDDKSIMLYVAGGNHAPGLVQFLDNKGLDIKVIPYQAGQDTAPETYSGEIDTKASFLIVINPDYQMNLNKFKPAKIFMYGDMGHKENAMSQGQIRKLIGAYGSQIAKVRVMSRGVAPSILSPFDIEVGDLSNSGAQGRMIAELMLLYFILAPFFASMAVAIDVTAGERERHSLQVLLAQPVSSRMLIMGKWGVAAGFGMIGTIITVVLGAIILSYAPLGALGIRLELSAINILSVIVAMTPLVLLVASAQMLIALFAKSFKEAQTYLTMLSFLPAMLGMMRSLTGTESEGLVGYLPVFADLEVLSGLLQSGVWQLDVWVISAAITLFLAFAFYMLAARLLDSERILATT